MLTPEILAKLTPEQKELAEKWERERDELSALIDALEVADAAGNLEDHNRIFKQILDSGSDFCEHNRSIWSPCSACHELEMILYPDMFDQDGNRQDLF